MRGHQATIRRWLVRSSGIRPQQTRSSPPRHQDQPRKVAEVRSYASSALARSTASAARSARRTVADLLADECRASPDGGHPCCPLVAPLLPPLLPSLPSISLKFALIADTH